MKNSDDNRTISKAQLGRDWTVSAPLKAVLLLEFFTPPILEFGTSERERVREVGRTPSGHATFVYVRKKIT